MSEENDGGLEDAAPSEDGIETQSEDQSSEDKGTESEKSTKSMLDVLDETEGVSFDFSTGEMPEGFPEEFWDAENNKVNEQALFDGLKKQEKIAKDLRAKMGKGEHKAPESADQYTFEPSESVAEFIDEGDPLVAAAKEIAHKHGLSQEQYAGFMSEISDKMVEVANEMGEEGSPMNEEAKAEYIRDQIRQIGPNGPQVLRAVQSWGNELLAEGTFSEEDVQTMTEEGLVSAKMVQMFNRLRARMGGTDVPHDTFDDGLPPDTEIAEMLDKAYISGDNTKIRDVEKLLDKRRRAGRPERLAF